MCYDPFKNFATALDNLAASTGRMTNYRDYFERLDAGEDTTVATETYEEHHNSKTL